jgi:Flp pilus assembly protein TadD
MTTRSKRGAVAQPLVAVILVAGIAAGTLLSGCAGYRGARLYHSGTLALDRGESTRAIADLEGAAELVPEASEVQNHLGLAYAAAGRADDARRAFQRAVDLDCDNQAAQANLHAAERHARVGEAP